MFPFTKVITKKSFHKFNETFYLGSRWYRVRWRFSINNYLFELDELYNSSNAYKNVSYDWWIIICMKLVELNLIWNSYPKNLGYVISSCFTVFHADTLEYPSKYTFASDSFDAILEYNV